MEGADALVAGRAFVLISSLPLFLRFAKASLPCKLLAITALFFALARFSSSPLEAAALNSADAMSSPRSRNASALWAFLASTMAAYESNSFPRNMKVGFAASLGSMPGFVVASMLSPEVLDESTSSMSTAAVPWFS